MKIKITRRRFIKNTALSTSGFAIGSNLLAAKNKGESDPFSFVLLGDLHLDRLEDHNLELLAKENPRKVAQIEHYCRVTSEITPSLFATVRKTIAELNKKSAAPTPFTIQLGDFVQGICSTAEVALRQNKWSLEFLKSSGVSTPFLFTKGNHEIFGTGSATAYRSLFMPFLSAQLRATGNDNGELNKGFFELTHGDALFLFFDAYDSVASLEWMEAALANRTARHVFVVIHKPVIPFGARANWHVFASAREVEHRNRLLNLLGKHRAIVLSGHLHKFNSMVRETSAGNFFQLGLWSIIPSLDVKPTVAWSGVEKYTVEQLEQDLEFSPETKQERHEIIEAEKPFVKHFDYSDLPGYAVLSVNGDNVEAKIYSGVSRKVWRTIDISALLGG